MQIDTSSLPAAGLPQRAAPAQPVVAATHAAPPAAAQPNPQALRDAVKAANAAVKSLANSLEFSVDEQSGRTVVRIVDVNTQQLIRQIPSEEMLAIAQALDKMQGKLIESQA